jgi:glutamine synthetase type III
MTLHQSSIMKGLLNFRKICNAIDKSLCLRSVPPDVVNMIIDLVFEEDFSKYANFVQTMTEYTVEVSDKDSTYVFNDNVICKCCYKPVIHKEEDLGEFSGYWGCQCNKCYEYFCNDCLFVRSQSTKRICKTCRLKIKQSEEFVRKLNENTNIL